MHIAIHNPSMFSSTIPLDTSSVCGLAYKHPTTTLSELANGTSHQKIKFERPSPIWTWLLFTPSTTLPLLMDPQTLHIYVQTSCLFKQFLLEIPLLGVFAHVREESIASKRGSCVT